MLDREVRTAISMALLVPRYSFLISVACDFLGEEKPLLSHNA